MLRRNKWYLKEEQLGEGGEGAGGDGGAAAAAAAPAAEGGTGEGGEGAGDAPDWRKEIAGDDEKMAKTLERFASPKALAEAFVNTRAKLSQSRPLLGKNATEEEVREYREALGIPEKAEGYDLSEFKLNDREKANIGKFLEHAHATNQTADQVKANVKAFQEISASIAADMHERDVKLFNDTTDALQQEWGASYRKNIQIINGMLDGAPAGLKDLITKGRLGDGTPLASNKDLLRWLLQLELDRNPRATVVPGAGERLEQTIDDEIKSIEAFMAKDRKAYNKDDKMQARYRELLEARESHKKKAA